MLASMKENCSFLPEVLRHWQNTIIDAGQRGTCLRVRGMSSKDHVGFVGACDVHGTLNTLAWQGIESYEPGELVLTVRAGTPLLEVEDLLASRGQYLAFEPPRGLTEAEGTIGGVVASGLSGPSRVSRGAVRDHVLGVRMLNGQGQYLRFGGTVMKNVAGFDLSRLMAGSMGTLGVLTDVTLKVLPQPVASETLHGHMDLAQAIRLLNLWASKPLPLDASCWHQGQLWLRLRGARAAVDAARAVLAHTSVEGGEARLTPWPQDADGFWPSIRDQQHAFFSATDGRALWRLSLPSTLAPGLPGMPAWADSDALVEWMGAQRWWRTSAPAAQVMAAAQAAGGHATLWRVAPGDDEHAVRQQVAQLAWQQWPAVMQQWHRQVQQAFDPHGVFDTGRLWPRRIPQA